MKLHIPFILSLIGGICGAPGQLGPPENEPSPERRPARVHASWTVFVHPAYQYALPVPPGVRAIGHPEDLSETSFQSADGSFLMSAWGGAFHQAPAALIAARWELALRTGNRNINYQRRGSTWFVVSGTDQEGIEYYEKFIMRGRHAAFMSIRFPRSQLRQFEQWVEHIEDGFRLVSSREGGLEMAPTLQTDPAVVGRNTSPAAGSPRGDAPISIEVRKKAPLHDTPEKVPAPGPARPGRSDDLDTSPQRDESNVPSGPTTNKALPTALKVEGKPGFVYSPYEPSRRLDVVGVPSGKTMKCPYSLKLFKVP